jgi:hypothetical protein
MILLSLRVSTQITTNSPKIGTSIIIIDNSSPRPRRKQKKLLRVSRKDLLEGESMRRNETKEFMNVALRLERKLLEHDKENERRAKRRRQLQTNAVQAVRNAIAHNGLESIGTTWSEEHAKMLPPRISPLCYTFCFVSICVLECATIRARKWKQHEYWPTQSGMKRTGFNYRGWKRSKKAGKSGEKMKKRYDILAFVSISHTNIGISKWQSKGYQ